MRVRAAPWPLRSACKQGRKGARLCSQRQEPCPNCCAEPQVPLPGVNQQRPEAPWGRALGCPRIWPSPGDGSLLCWQPWGTTSIQPQCREGSHRARGHREWHSWGTGTSHSTQGRKKCPEPGSLAAPWQPPPLMPPRKPCRDGREEPGAGLSQQEWLEWIPAWNHCLSAPHAMPCVPTGG